MTNTLRIKLCQKLEAVLKSIGHTIGIIDIPLESHTNALNHRHSRRRKAKVKVANIRTKQQSTPQKVIVSPKTGVNDALLIGASLRELNRQAARAHKKEEKEDFYDYNDYLDDDEFIDDDFDFLDGELAYHDEENDLLNDDIYDNDYTDYDRYPFIDDNISPSGDFDEY